MAVGALANGGLLVTPTFLKRSVEDAQRDAPRVIRPEVSEGIRYVMRLNAEVGSARNANIPGYFIGGKTGTADKLVHGHYDHDKVFTTFMAVLPADKPKYLFLTLMDEPQAIPGTYGYHTRRLELGRRHRQDHRARRPPARPAADAEPAAAALPSPGADGVRLREHAGTYCGRPPLTRLATLLPEAACPSGLGCIENRRPRRR